MRRILALIFAICLALGMLAACSQAGNDSQVDTTTVADNTTQEPVTEDSESLFQPVYDSLPALDYGMDEVKIVLRTEDRYADEMMVDEFDTSAVPAAIYARNMKVSERLNVDLLFYPVGNGHGPWTNIENSITTGSCNYDIVDGSAAPASGQFQKGLYRNLRNLDYLDLSKDYWSQGIVENQTIAGATYGITGSLSTYFYDSAFVIYFNRNLCSANGISPDSIYELVMDKNWTLDEMISLTKDFWIDNDGNGIADAGDTYGFGLQVTSSTDGFTSSCQVDYLIESVDKIEIAMDLAKVSNIVTKLDSFLWDNNGVCALAENKNYISENIYLFDSQFASDKLLFVTDWLYSTSTITMRNMKSDFGVLPYPLYDTNQEEYSTYVHDKFSLFAVPVTVKAERTEMIGAVLEALASEGHNVVMPAYYEKALTHRYIRDPESVKTMEIIVSNIFIDKLWSLDINIPRYTLRQLVWDHSTDVVSAYRQYYETTKGKLDDIFTNYAKYAEN